jgi:hypothetical protein
VFAQIGTFAETFAADPASKGFFAGVDTRVDEEGGRGGECFVADGTGVGSRVGVETLVLGEDFLRCK